MYNLYVKFYLVTAASECKQISKFNFSLMQANQVRYYF